MSQEIHLGKEPPTSSMKEITAGCQWLTPVILATWEAEIRRTSVPDSPEQIEHKTPSLK
jgi:hypothetical protein